MDFSYDEMQTAVSGLARSLFKERVTQASLRTTEADPDRIDRALWKELAKLDLLGATQHGLLATCALLVEQGAAVAPVPLWATLILGAMPIEKFGSDDQKKRWLAGVTAGETILTAALEEGDVVAERSGSTWQLRGEKQHVPAAHLAARMLIPAKTTGGEIVVLLVDPRANGVKLERQIGTTGEPAFHVTFDGARADEGDRLGGVEVLEWLVPRATVGLAAIALGVADRALRMTAEYTTTRTQFDRPVATFQAVAQRAADAYIDVEAMRVTLWQAVWRLANDLPAAHEVALAKFWACDGGHRVTYAAQHLHGGMGFDLEYPLHRHYLWAKQIELTLGSAPVHLARLGDECAVASAGE